MDCRARDFMEPFKSVGITPPRGRQGHSVPTPRPLQGSKLVHVAGRRIEDKGEVPPPPPSIDPPNLPPKVFPTRFSMRRDHSLGGSVSRLDRIRAARPQEIPQQLESFVEHEDEGSREGEIGTFPDGPYHDDSEAWLHPFSRISEPHVHDTLDKFTGDSMLHFSFNPGGNFTSSNEPQLGGSFVRAFTSQGLHTSLNIPSVHHLQTGESSNLFPSAARNPNKAIVTIDAHSSLILMTNEITCELFGYQRGDLVGMKVQNLFTEPYRAKQHALVEHNIDASGKEVLVSGKVLDAVTLCGVEFPVSVWMKKISVSSGSHRVIVVMEPVERTSACFSLDQQGCVVSCDPWFASLFGYPNTLAVIGQSVHSLIPSLSLPCTLDELAEMPEKQAVTGRTKDNTAFPLTVQFTDLSQNLSLGDLYSPPHTLTTGTQSPQGTTGTCHNITTPPHTLTTSTHSTQSTTGTLTHTLPMGEVPINLEEAPPPNYMTDETSTKSDVREAPPINDDDVADGEVPSTPPPDYINAKVIVYSALSGMVSFLPDGTIHGCNHHFSLMLFGYSQDELLKKDITFLMPEFYNHIGYVDDHGMPLPPLDEDCGEISFQSVVERSLSPDAAFEYIKSRGVQAHVPPSPVRRKHEVQRSPARKYGHSPSHHHHRPLNLSNTAAHLEGANISPQHQIVAKTIPGGISGPLAMPTLLEEEEKENNKKMSNCFSETSGDDNAVIAGEISSHLETLAATLTGEEITQTRESQTGTETRERDGGALEEAGGGVNNSLEPSSSTPASKSSESTLAHVKKSNSFHEFLGAGGGSSDCDRYSVTSMASLPEGLFEGFIRHKDGSSIGVIFQLKRIPLTGDQSVFCMWVCRDLDRERAVVNTDHPMARPDLYWTDQVVSPDVEDVDGGHPQHPMAYEEAVAVGGVYMTCYDTLRPVGKGAFGFVRLAQRKSDKQMVVVKFLRKSGVLKDCWVDDEEMGTVALEISLLARLNHPNIVTLLEAYENEHYFQLVMDKHGDGLDLFEFIERCPRVTEPLVSYMFRQVVAGLSYLHGKNILHRDVKDENIIMDQSFRMKLIDFGSAAYMEPGKLFHTFCGTLEYCSPEVLLGNSYPGPELEMWALGVTLYTLVFGENPFFDVEETISGHLQPPYLTSPGLMKVLFWLLHPHPKSRATLKDLERDKWTNQKVDVSQFNFETVLVGVGLPPVPCDHAVTETVSAVVGVVPEQPTQSSKTFKMMDTFGRIILSIIERLSSFGGYTNTSQLEDELQKLQPECDDSTTIDKLLDTKLRLQDSHGNSWHSDQGD